MRVKWTSAVFAAASLLLVPQFAVAADLETEIADMKQRMEVMEDQLRAQGDDLAEAQATVEKQNDVIEQAGLEEREEVSALSAFIEGTDFSAWVATSYNYNFEGSTDQAGGSTTGNIPNNIGTFTHPFSNTFQLDQAWISIDKTPTEESRAGAHFDLQAGVSTTTAYNAGAGGGGAGAPTGVDGVGIYSAYVSYLAPLMKGLRIDAGIVPTAIGWEVEQTNANITVTRGFLWTNQPVTSTGATATLSVTDRISVMAGILNDPYNRNPTDVDRAKALTSKVAFTGEKFGASAALNYGRSSAGHSAAGGVNNSLGILDAIIWITPGDNLSASINYDYFFETNTLGGTSADLTGHGLSIQGRLGIFDSLGIGGRFEYVTFTDGLLPAGADKLDVYTITGTVDWALTDNMTLRPEVRWDNSSVAFYPTTTGLVQQDQVIALAQLMYEF